ncbi:MAG: chromosome segregation protein SMC [Betaproteobacteria bacterium RIFCSPLOWO2_02_FULL_67_26]|nr:MAG: chromosome segregation protein SMC [Betaproteobacteria bacterium RIFCSPLOWO2_02_FULL_67_26]
MRLKQINLAGFKSFVDPTHIPVPGQLVGIVGPNGCGKSNVIDAVRWVLGETSAKHLRGDTMQDILFNGSGQRQPVNRSSVELIFDNSLGRAGGQWSSYAEISVKRVLARDGEATSYYINNVHVRRRDVADIFLGTGLGSRAYAIIEQGMISRVIEAKPEDLRVFLEEAAGVSKYRARRHETELRLKDTRENLLRVEDVRAELEKQLEHLQSQAEVATRYHELQAKLRATQNLLSLLRKQEAGAQRARQAREIERLTLELEADTAALRNAEKRVEELRARHYRGADAVHAAQGAFYEANAETARLEQELAHVRENRQRVERELAELRAQSERDRESLAAAQGSLAEVRGERSRAEETLARREAALRSESDKLPVAEEAFRATRNRYDELQRALALDEQAMGVEETKRAHGRQTLDQLAIRAQRLQEERSALQPADAARLAQLYEEIAAFDRELQRLRAAIEDAEQELPRVDGAWRECDAAREASGQHLAGLEARRQALTQLQERLARGANTAGWLEARGLNQALRLWQEIRIEPGWEDALESVLRERLNAIALEHVDQAGHWFGEPPPGKVTVFEPARSPSPSAPPMAGCEPLLRYITCTNSGLEAVVRDWLHQVYVVADAAGGLAARERLPAGALMVTREGHVFTRHAVSFHAPDSELHGVLTRQREIEQLGGAIARAQPAFEALQRSAGIAEKAVEQARRRLDELRDAVNGMQSRHHALQLEALKLAELDQRMAQRLERIAAETAENEAQAGAAATGLQLADRRVAGLQGEVERQRTQLALATDLYRRAENVLELQRAALQQTREETQQAVFQKQSCDNKIIEITNSINAISENERRLAAALDTRQNEYAAYDETPLQQRLQEALTAHAGREQALAAVRDALESMESALKATDEERHACEQRLEPLRERIAETRLKEQEARLNEEQHAQQLADAGAHEDEVARQLEKGMRPGALAGEIARLNEEVKALGAVNLAALEELTAARGRKEYLDAQSRDLAEAMATLEDAIRRIDRETRERLQHTFDEVNRHFSEMFPALFGGGHARLILTGEEILDAGVLVQAQPPGKKNTTIQLLSGGEKALTALALVFSMFQLNPAPFCLLDEVDAPLDDYNTGRFCDLVRKMSQHSQFLFISHNKITMEIAEQLLGITMQEPGVSRVVAVDIEEAMKIREAAA